MLLENGNLQHFAQEEAAEETAAAGDMAPDAGERQDFDELIRGQYKAEFDQRVQKILDGRLRSLRRENERLRRHQQTREEAVRRSFTALTGEEEKVRAIYPEFDWRREIRNPAFGRLIAAGVDSQTAYEVVHSRELMGRAMAYSARRSAQRAAASVAAQARRVGENGRGSTAVTAADPRKLTPQELSDIRRRVLDGEKIRF